MRVRGARRHEVVKPIADLLNRLASPRVGEDGGSGAATPEQLLKVVATHGLLPHLRDLAPDLPVPFSEQLPSYLHGHGRRCLELTSELFALLDLFDLYHVPIIPFKGPVLAVQLYGDPAARSFSDLDVIVPPAHAVRALALLETRGYQLSPSLRRFPFRWWLRSTDHVQLTGNGMIVELHWALGERGSLPMDPATLWSGLVPVRVGGRVVRTLSRDQLAIYLAAHGSKHAWERLEWIFDFGQLVRTSPPLDWSRIAAAARRRGMERALFLALRLASDLMDLPVPEALAARVEGDRRVRELAGRVVASIGERRPFAEQPWTRLHSFSLCARERWRDRIRHLAHLALTPGPNDWTPLRLPNELYGLYYLLRPVRLVGKYARRALGTA